MITAPLIGATLAAAAGGAVLAGCGTPACHWSSLGAMMLKTRLGMLRQAAPGKRRVRLAALGLSGLLCAGALAAYAAQPGAPERLPAEAVGVVGSGDQLALRVVRDSQERTLRHGDDYADGWKLDKLTPTSVTLAKDGERREVGLNPTGALASAQPAAPPSRVRVALSDAELLDKAIAIGLWDGKTPAPGLSLEETARLHLLRQKGLAQIPPGPPRAPDGLMIPRQITGDMVNDALGPDAAEYVALLGKQDQANYDLAVAAFQRFGPVEVPIPANREADARLKADYPSARWSARPGGATMVMVMPLSPSAFAALVQGKP